MQLVRAEWFPREERKYHIIWTFFKQIWRFSKLKFVENVKSSKTQIELMQMMRPNCLFIRFVIIHEIRKNRKWLCVLRAFAHIWIERRNLWNENE